MFIYACMHSHSPVICGRIGEARSICALYPIGSALRSVHTYIISVQGGVADGPKVGRRHAARSCNTTRYEHYKTGSCGPGSHPLCTLIE